MKLCTLACLRKSHTHCRIGSWIRISATFSCDSPLGNHQKMIREKLMIWGYPFLRKLPYMGHTGFIYWFKKSWYPRNMTCFATLRSHQLRSIVGNHQSSNRLLRNTARHQWHCHSHWSGVEKTHHQGLDWINYTGAGAKVELHPWLAQSLAIIGNQVGGWPFVGWKCKSSISQHASTRFHVSKVTLIICSLDCLFVGSYFTPYK